MPNPIRVFVEKLFGRKNYPYQVWFKRAISPEDEDLYSLRNKAVVADGDGVLNFLTPLVKGEMVLLPSHMQELWKLPDWVNKQSTWRIEEVIHQADSPYNYDPHDIALLSPALENPINALIGWQEWPFKTEPHKPR
jgi:hypothetical protein